MFPVSAKRSAGVLQRPKQLFNAAVRRSVGKVSKPTRVGIKTQKNFLENISSKLIINNRNFEFNISIYTTNCNKSAQVLIVSNIKDSHFRKRKVESKEKSFLNKRRKKRSDEYSDSIFPLHRRFPTISGYQIIFLVEAKTWNSSMFYEILKAAEQEHLTFHNKSFASHVGGPSEGRGGVIQGLRKLKLDNTEIYRRIKQMPTKTVPSVDPNKFFPSLRDHLQTHAQHQYAFAIFIMKHSNNIIVSPEFRTDYKKQHSERLLCDAIGPFLEQNGFLVERVVIYTYNSPCPDCAAALEANADSWFGRYGFITTVIFTKFYGLSNKEPFPIKSITSPDLLGSRDVFYDDRRRCERATFQLGSFKDEHNVRSNIKKLGDKEERKRFRKYIESCVSELKKLAKTSVCTREEHLRRGNVIIASFKFPPIIQQDCENRLHKSWRELVSSSATENIRKTANLNFNVRIVEVINQELQPVRGSRSLQLYHTPLSPTQPVKHVNNITKHHKSHPL